MNAQDCLQMLREIKDVSFASVDENGMPHNRIIDVMIVFTTDGQLSTADAVVLTDDLNFFPSCLCGNVVRSEVLEQYPELQDVFDQLTGRIQNEDMVEMNYEVEVEGKEPLDAAQAFLEECGLIE